LFDISEATHGVVFYQPTRQLLISSTGYTVDRQVFSDLLVVAKVFFRVEVRILLLGCFFVQLYDKLVKSTR
jgi:hypothetical protein